MVVSDLWTIFKAGVILTFATSHAAQLTDGGDFIVVFIVLLVLLLAASLFQYEFVGDAPQAWSAQFEPLRLVFMGALTFFVLYVSYLLTQQLLTWFRAQFMNGPFVTELFIEVFFIIFIFNVFGIVVGRRLTPSTQDVRELRAIALR